MVLTKGFYISISKLVATLPKIFLSIDIIINKHHTVVRNLLDPKTASNV